MECEKVDTAHSLQLVLTLAPPLFPSFFLLPFLLLSLPSRHDACYFLGIKSRRGSCKMHAISTSSEITILTSKSTTFDKNISNSYHDWASMP